MPPEEDGKGGVVPVRHELLEEFLVRCPGKGLGAVDSPEKTDHSVIVCWGHQPFLICIPIITVFRDAVAYRIFAISGKKPLATHFAAAGARSPSFEARERESWGARPGTAAYILPHANEFWG